MEILVPVAKQPVEEWEGLSGRPWYKHMVSCGFGKIRSWFITYHHAYGKEIMQIYGPSLYNDYGAEVYPGADDAIQTAKKTNTSESWQSVQHEIHRIARVISQAALVLSGGLT
uniref:Transferrin receptor-like dimerisation domain-containing protein n=1 Tax=Aegilops tauschii TaxID=37682 RepID=M8BXB0_AEGTA